MINLESYIDKLIFDYNPKIDTNIIDGKAIAKHILNKIEKDIQFLKDNFNLVPTLKVIIVGDNPASKIYVSNKKKVADKIGINCDIDFLPENIYPEELYKLIDKYNNDTNINALIVQLPLPKIINVKNVISKISPLKDVDGFTVENTGKLFGTMEDPIQDKFYVACTPIGSLIMLKTIYKNLSGKHAVIIGRSSIVGRPLAALFLRNNLTVTICHSHTENLPKISRKADIVVVAAGKPKFFGADYFNENSTVIDVGISKNFETNLISGDTDFENIFKNVKYITPVPGGVGPMTVASLMINTVNALKFQKNIDIV